MIVKLLLFFFNLCTIMIWVSYMKQQKIEALINEFIHLKPKYKQCFFRCHDLLTNYSITHQEFVYLSILKHNPKHMSQISNEHGVSPQQLSRLSDSLEKKELIVRYIDTENRRRIKSELTEKGLKTFQEILTGLSERTTTYFTALSEDEISLCIQSLETVNHILDKLEI